MMTTPSQYKRESPFLHRVWKSVVGEVTKLSSTNGDKPVADELTPRATKRRRITEDCLDSGAITSVSPFYQEPPEDFDKGLRIEVLRIGRNEYQGHHVNGFTNGQYSPPKRDVTVIKARCRLTIFRFKPKVEMRVIYCDSQICEVKLLRDAEKNCRAARVYLRQPFFVAADKIFIERDDDQGFSLADDYLIQTELESAGDPHWPPMELFQGQEYSRPSTNPSRQWVLSSRFTYKFTKGRMSTVVVLRKSTGNDAETDLKLETDLRWSTYASSNINSRTQDDISSENRAPSLNGALEPLTNGHINGRVESLVNGHRNEIQDLLDEDDDPDGEAVTPSRSLRMRDKVHTYNLKLLSDKARGKELKDRRKRNDAARAAENGQVTWLLPSGGRVLLDNWACVRCYALHASFEQLKAHIGVHEEFKYSFDSTPRGGCRIAISRHGQETPRAIRTAEVQAPLSPEELESDSGDDLSPQKPAAPRPRPKLPVRRSTVIKPRDTKQVLPNIKQTLFDRLSKAILEPGSRVDEPQIDNSWLMQKHRDIIKDYTDVHPDEKEYISEWDAFSYTHKATLSPFLQDIYLDFLDEKSAWLSASQNRMTEAMKHLIYLSARDALNEDTVAKALEIMRDARLEVRQQGSDVENPPPKPELRQSKSGCGVCGQPVLGPSQLICSNALCSHFLYHDDCVRDDAKVPVETRNWRCNECFGKETTT